MTKTLRTLALGVSLAYAAYALLWWIIMPWFIGELTHTTITPHF